MTCNSQLEVGEKLREKLRKAQRWSRLRRGPLRRSENLENNVSIVVLSSFDMSLLTYGVIGKQGRVDLALPMHQEY